MRSDRRKGRRQGAESSPNEKTSPPAPLRTRGEGCPIGRGEVVILGFSSQFESGFSYLCVYRSSLPKRGMSDITIDTLKSTAKFFCMTHCFLAVETVQPLFVNLEFLGFYLRIQHEYYPDFYRHLHCWD